MLDFCVVLNYLTSEFRNIILYDQYMAFYLETRKTDQFRDGSWIMIACTGTELCPVENTKKLINWGKLEGDNYLFCNISKTKKGFKVRNVNKQMSYTNLRQLFMNAVKPHVADVTVYCLHSLRAGGASAAANNGVKDQMFKRHGRWTSESAKDGYVKDNLHERLSASLCLEL